MVKKICLEVVHPHGHPQSNLITNQMQKAICMLSISFFVAEDGFEPPTFGL
jgi:hypothetical protein